MNLLIKLLVSTLGIIITAYLLSGVMIDGIFTAFVAALILGIINVIIKPILIILTLPINFLTLGLFTFVINAGLIMLVAAIVPGFNVAGFWWAILFGIVLSIINFFLNLVIKD